MKKAIPLVLFLMMTFLFAMNGQSLDGRNRRRRIQARPAPSPTPIPPVIVTNPVNVPHTFTVLVETEQGNHWRPIPDALVTVTLTSIDGAQPDPAGPFTGSTDNLGQYSITFTSAKSGTITAHAVASSTGLTAATDGIYPNSGDATKIYLKANIRVLFIPPITKRKK